MQTRLLPDDVPVDPLDEQLVAYLDGELAPDERDALEQRLVDDADLRQRLQQLQGGWEMLDALPQATVGEQFTETTLEMVAADASRQVKSKQARLWRRQWSLPAVAVLLTVAAVGLGAAGVAVARHWEMRRQLRDLPLAQHLDAYLRVDDLELMRRLAADEDWNDAIEAAQTLREMRLPDPAADLQQVPLDDREEVLSKLGIEDRELLAADWRNFEQLKPDQRASVRRVAQQVQSEPNAQQLLRTMDAFILWYQSLEPEVRTEIDSSQGQQRERVMREAMERSKRDWISRSGRLLSDDDTEAIYNVMHSVAREWLEEIANFDGDLPRRSAYWLERSMHRYSQFGHADPEAALLNYVYVIRNQGRYGPSVSEPGGAEAQEPLESLTLADKHYEQVRIVLSEKAQQRLHSLAPAHQLQREMLDQWIYDAVLRKTGDGQNTLRIERLLSMDPSEREVLELSPPETIFGRLDRSPRRFEFFSGSRISGGRSGPGGHPPGPPIQAPIPAQNPPLAPVADPADPADPAGAAGND